MAQFINTERKSFESLLCRIVVAVEKPELVIESKPEHHFLRGRSSTLPRGSV
jgi:hypothetical protein